MHYAAKKWAVDRAIKGMPRFVLIMLAVRIDMDMVCSPKIRTIARHVGATERTVQRALRCLEAAQLIETIPQYGDHGGRINNKYRLLMPVESKESPPGRRTVIPLLTQRNQGGDDDVTRNTTTKEGSYETPLQRNRENCALIFPGGLSVEEIAET